MSNCINPISSNCIQYEGENLYFSGSGGKLDEKIKDLDNALSNLSSKFSVRVDSKTFAVKSNPVDYIQELINRVEVLTNTKEEDVLVKKVKVNNESKTLLDAIYFLSEEIRKIKEQLKDNNSELYV